MSPRLVALTWPTLLGAAALTAFTPLSGCSSSKTSAAEPATPAAPQTVAAVSPVVQPLVRSLRVTGSLMADEQAEVSAEVAGRVTGTPIERGSRVNAGALLVQLSTEQATAQLLEAQANADRIAAGLGITEGRTLDPERVPDVANARAELQLAESEYERIRSLLDQRVVSQSEYDQRQTRVEAAKHRYESERNKAQQDYRSWEAARARVTLARKGLSDTSVRAPFAGLVVERFVSEGDFVATGTRVATVVRIDPLRVVLTVPEQQVAQVRTGQPVTFTVDAYPGRQFQGTVKFISPALRAEQRALTVEAIVANGEGQLKPGLFATAELAQTAEDALLIDKRAIREVGKTSRVFVVNKDTLEERIVTVGQAAGALVEVVSGLDKTAVVALPGSTPLSEGMRVRVTPAAPAEASSTTTPH